MQLCALMEHTSKASGLDLWVKTGLAAVHRSAAAILPLYALNYALLVLSALTEVAMTKMDAHLHQYFRE